MIKYLFIFIICNSLEVKEQRKSLESDFLNTISLKPIVEDLRYFKL